MSEIECIPKGEVAAARRRLCREVASAILVGMAHTDSSVEQIAERLGTKPADVRRTLNRLIEGRDGTLDKVAEIVHAMGLYLRISLAPHESTPSGSEVPNDQA